MAEGKVDPKCTFSGECFARNNGYCEILIDMPKKRPGGCPFRKKNQKGVADNGKFVSLDE
jgi:hypothetical protein